jgi:hypothetical protein
MTQSGTTCPSQAEDATADAFSRSTAWQTHIGAADETEALTEIYFNSLPLPNDNFAFTVGELEERGTVMMILMDPEDGFRVVPGEAQGVLHEGGNILVIIERLIPQSEVSNPAIDQNRKLLDIVVQMMTQATKYLLTTKGQRWMRPMRLAHPPTLNHYKKAKVEGYRQHATIAIEWGVGGDDKD